MKDSNISTSNKGFMDISIVLVILLVIAVGFAAYSYVGNQNEDDGFESDHVVTPTAEPVKSAEDIDTQLSELEQIDVDSELDTSELDAEASSF